ncbi:TrbC family F-type conjugative pilus assembly protein [Photobacterium angustum]|nr:TrbC family F-type conjugative pilus assembly protein [Photobacterium angustum]
MLFIKLKKTFIFFIVFTFATVVRADFSAPTEAELEALRSTHDQFDGLMLDEESAYGASKRFIDGISIMPTEVRHPARVFTKEDSKLFSKSAKVANKIAENEQKKPEWMRDVSAYLPESENIKDIAKKGIEERIKKAYPDAAKKNNVEVVRSEVENEFLQKDESLYYFITSSMEDVEIKDILISAKETGAIVVLRGMIPGSMKLTDTSYYLMRLLKEADLHTSPPKVIMDPRLFNIYNIKMAPAMVFVKNDIEVLAHGLVSPEWFIAEARLQNSFKDLGELSAVNPIVEKDILALMQERYEKIDWKKQRENAKKKFFARQTFKPFPIPREDKHYELDPRIVFIKDVKAGNKIMAKKGDVVNPLAGFDGQNLSLFIIDPRDARQRSLIKERLDTDSVGMPQVIVSHFDAAKQFDGIEELQRELDHKIFMLQKTYIDRFKIDALPIRIDIIGGKGIWIREYGIETLNEIHERNLNVMKG